MSTSFPAVRQGLQAALATLGVSAYDVWPDQILVPCAIVKPKDGMFHFARGAATAPMKLAFEIVFLAASAENGLDFAQRALDSYLGTGSGSVQSALEADQSLSGSVTSVVCHQWHSYGAVAVDQIEYAGVIFDVDVITA